MKIIISKRDLADSYVKYACDEVTDNTMTMGEFIKKLETDEDFYKRFFPKDIKNDYDWSNNNEI
jgi:hypothetical protein